MSTENGRNFVEFALKIGAIELIPGGRKLKSGRMSPYFFNSGLFHNGETLNHLARAYSSALLSNNEQAEVLFGPAYKGIPLVSSIVAQEYGESKTNWGFAFDRKEVKDHGEGGRIVGSNLEGKTVEIIDDVVTSGQSILEARDLIINAGGTVTGATIAFDRQERGLDSEHSATIMFAQKHNIRIRASACLEDLIVVLQQQGSDMLDDVIAYYRQYG